MFSRSPSAPVLRLGALVAVLFTACSVFAGESTTTTSDVTTSAATTTTIAFPERSTTSTTIGAGVDPDVASVLQSEVASLIRQAEAIRGLQFVEEPVIAIVSAEEFALLLDNEFEVARDSDAVAADQAVYRLLGLLEPGADLAVMLREAYEGDYTGFYDPDARRLVVSGSDPDLSGIERAALFHEIVHALADQYFAAEDELTALTRSGPSDAGAAFEALAEGDATYFQLVYTQGLSAADRASIARDTGAVTGEAVTGAPAWLLEDLAFPYDAGLEFVTQLVAGGGIAAVDRAYLDPPISTEQILHPERFRIGEAVRPLPEMDVSLDGYEQARAGSIGEWGMRRLLHGTLSPALLTQTAEGWGADAVATLRSGSDVAFALMYAADSEEDAVDVATALVAHARTVMGAGNGIEVDGGILFDEGGPWVFIDRIGDGLVFVAATDAAAGRELRPQVTVP
jgi:hypothetical protein